MCRTERSELTDSCPKDKYKFKLGITNNTNSSVCEIELNLVDIPSRFEL